MNIIFSRYHVCSKSDPPNNENIILADVTYSMCSEPKWWWSGSHFPTKNKKGMATTSRYKLLPLPVLRPFLWALLPYKRCQCWWKSQHHLVSQWWSSGREWENTANLPSLKLIASLPLKIGPQTPQKERIIWTNHPFSGAMLVSGRVELNDLEDYVFEDAISSSSF